VKTDDFDFDFPSDLIAKWPAPRGQSRLVVVRRRDRPSFFPPSPDDAMPPASPCAGWGSIQDLKQWLNPGDALVLNDTQVLRARLRGTDSMGRPVEALLLKPAIDPECELAFGQCLWEALVKPGKRFRPGDMLRFSRLEPSTSSSWLQGEVQGIREDGVRVLRLGVSPEELFPRLEKVGDIPLPPYIDRPTQPEDEERYQSVFAREPGSVAAPTASLHFTASMLAELRELGIQTITVTLHVGAGTFKPVATEEVEAHTMHRETYTLGLEQAERMNEVRARGGRLIAVGTTAARVLETCATGEGGRLQPGSGETELFVLPGYHWKAVDGLITNFHWPRSTLFMLVCSLVGTDHAKAVYGEAIERGYRLFSYGDAMLIG